MRFHDRGVHWTNITLKTAVAIVLALGSQHGVQAEDLVQVIHIDENHFRPPYLIKPAPCVVLDVPDLKVGKQNVAPDILILARVSKTVVDSNTHQCEWTAKGFSLQLKQGIRRYVVDAEHLAAPDTKVEPFTGFKSGQTWSILIGKKKANSKDVSASGWTVRVK